MRPSIPIALPERRAARRALSGPIALALLGSLGLVALLGNGSGQAPPTAVAERNGTAFAPRLGFTSQHDRTLIADRGEGAAPWFANAPAGSQPSVRAGALAFVSRAGGTDGDIAYAPLSATAPTTLLSDDFPDADPDLSPDGQTVAYASRRGDTWHLFTVTTTQPRRVRQLTSGTADDHGPSWSPDGAQLVFGRTTRDDPTGDLFVLTLATGQVRQLTTDPAVDADPAWAPGGNRIAFSTNRFGAPGDVAIVAATGGAVTRLTAGRTPAWSADGATVAFVDTRVDRRGNVLTVPAAGGAPQPKYARADRAEDDPAFTPDGTVIATAAESPAGNRSGIRAVHLDGTRPAELVDEPGRQEGGPSFAPDGRRLAFALAGTGGIWVSDVDGRNARRLTRPGEGVVHRDPVWSPNGRFIAFAESLDGLGTIVLISVDTGDRLSTVACAAAPDPVAPSPVPPPPPSFEPPPPYPPPPTTSPAGPPPIPVIRGPAIDRPIVRGPATEGCVDRQPAWAPDSRSLAFARGVRLAESPLLSRVFVVAVDPNSATTGAARQVTADDRSATVVRTDEGPSFAPAGDRIAFTARTTVYATSFWDNDVLRTFDQVVTVRPTGAERRVVLDSRTNPLRLAGFDEPAWAPDGGTLVFAAFVGEGDLDLYSAAPDGSRLRLVYAAPGDDSEPDFQPAADLVVTLDRAPPGVLLGRASQITVTVTDAASYAAPDAAVAVTVPSGLNLRAITPSAGTCTRAPLRCAFGVLDAGARVTVTLDVTGSAVGVQEVTATATQDRFELDPPDNTDRATVTVDSADISVTTRVAPPLAFVGGAPIVVRYTVRSTGTGSTGAARFTATLPIVLPVRSVRVTATGGAVPACPTPTAGCDLGPFPPDRQVVIEVTLTPAVAILSAAVGTVDAPESTGDVTDDTDRAPIRVETADVGVTARAVPDRAFVGGDPVAVRFTVTNLGSGPAGPVRFTATLPGALPVRSVAVTTNASSGVARPAVAAPSTGDGASPSTTQPRQRTAPACRNPAGGCNLGVFPPGREVVVEVLLNPAAALAGTAAGTIASAFESPGGAANNRAEAAVEVTAPRLRVTPGTGRGGFAPMVVGTNFPPGAKVRLRWDRGVMSRTEPVAVNTNGGFAVPILVFHKDVRGTRAMVATRAAGPAFGPVSEVYVVLPGSDQPDDWVYRR